MNRITPNRCGYTGYRCAAAPVIDEVLYSGFTHNPDINGDIPDGGEGLIMNYLDLPTKAKGMVTTTFPLFKMYYDGLFAPEQTCLNTVEVDTKEGFQDFFYRFKGKVTGNNVASDPNNMTASTNIPGATDTWKIYEEIGGAATSTDTYFLHPGIIEPLLNTTYPETPVIGPTRLDGTLDGIMLTIMQLVKWQQWVNTKLHGVQDAVDVNVKGFEDLVASVAALASGPTAAGCTDNYFKMTSKNSVAALITSVMWFGHKLEGKGDGTSVAISTTVDEDSTEVTLYLTLRFPKKLTDKTYGASYRLPTYSIGFAEGKAVNGETILNYEIGKAVYVKPTADILEPKTFGMASFKSDIGHIYVTSVPCILDLSAVASDEQGVLVNTENSIATLGIVTCPDNATT